MAQPAAHRAEGDATSDANREYRRALGSFATGLTVVTCALADGRRTGLTVNSFASVSLEPPLVSWCLARSALSFEMFESAPYFAVNVLAVEQAPLVHWFARRTLEKLDDVAWAPGLGGAPLLDGCVARFECRRTAAHSGGDHVIFLGAVERYARFAGEPLVLVRGRYGQVGDG